MGTKRKLTDRFVANLKPAAPGRRDDYWDASPPGFGVRVTDRGSRTYVLYTRWPPTGVVARRAIGDAAKMSLATARRRAKEWLDMVEQGLDPREEERRAARAAVRQKEATFGAVAEAYIEEHLSGLRRGKDDAREMRRYLLDPKACDWARRPVAEITRRDVVQRVTEIKRTSAHQAHQVLGHVKRIFSWAVEQDAYGLEQSPAVLVKPKKVIGEKKPRQRVLTDDELRAYWRAASRTTYPFGDMYRLIALTGVRISEASDARWPEFPAELRRPKGDTARLPTPARLWTIPPERFKSDAHHVVPLSDEACALVAALPRFRQGDHLFTTTLGEKPVGGFSKAKARLDCRMLRTLRALARLRGDDPAAVKLEPFVIHDVRRTVRTRLAALRVPDNVAEMVIGHGKKGLQRVYDQHAYVDEMREALQRWAALLVGIAHPAPPPDNVVAISGARA